MKTINIILAVLVTMIASQAQGQQAFSSVTLANNTNGSELRFSVPREANVYQYRVLAGYDSTDMTLVGTVKPTSNCVSAQNYHYAVSEPIHKYYRVVLVGMDAKMRYSPVVSSYQPGVKESKQAPERNADKSFTGCMVAKSN